MSISRDCNEVHHSLSCSQCDLRAMDLSIAATDCDPQRSSLRQADEDWTSRSLGPIAIHGDPGDREDVRTRKDADQGKAAGKYSLYSENSSDSPMGRHTTPM